MQLLTTEIIKSPIVTEKSTAVKKSNCYVFHVSPRATKGQIKQAVEELFKVKVSKVRTGINPGKFRRMGATGGWRSDIKKAYVTLKSGYTIKIGE